MCPAATKVKSKEGEGGGERAGEKDDEESSWAGLLRAKDNAHNFTEKERGREKGKWV